MAAGSVVPRLRMVPSMVRFQFSGLIFFSFNLSESTILIMTGGETEEGG